MFGAQQQKPAYNPNNDVEVAVPAEIDGISSLCWSPAASHLVASSWSNSVYLWDVQPSGQTIPKAQLTDHKQPVLCTAFNQDGSQVFTGGCDKTVRLWNLATNQSTQVGCKTPCTPPVTPHAQGRVMCEPRGTGYTCLHTLKPSLPARPCGTRTHTTHTLILQKDHRHDTPMRHCFFHAHTHVHTQTQPWMHYVLLQVAAHDAPVRHCFFAPNLNMLITGSWDKTMKFWDCRSPTPAFSQVCVCERYGTARTHLHDGHTHTHMRAHTHTYTQSPTHIHTHSHADTARAHLCDGRELPLGSDWHSRPQPAHLRPHKATAAVQDPAVTAQVADTLCGVFPG